MAWGVNRREKTLQAQSSAIQRPPGYNESPPVMNKGMQWIVEAPTPDGIPAMTGTTPGEAVCLVRYIDVAGQLVDMLNSVTGGDQYLTVKHLGKEKIDAQELRIAQQIGGVPTIGPEAKPPEANVIWMRFVTDEKIVDRVVDATVEIVTGQVINPLTSLPFVPGDTVTLHDPTNMWPTIEANATGIAYYRKALDEQAPLPHENRWEIEECSLPVNLIRAKLDGCLKYGDITGVARFGTNAPSGYEVPDWVLSEQNNCDFPPEITVGSTEDYTITFQNAQHLDGTDKAVVTLRRHTDQQESDPNNVDTPQGGSATAALWELVEVERGSAAGAASSPGHIARWSSWTWTGGTPIAQQFFEGDSPIGCGPVTLTPMFSTACLKDGDTIVAFYDPEADTYRGIATQSAYYGSGDTITTGSGFNFDGCTLKWNNKTAIAFCVADGAEGSAALPTGTINSIDQIYASGTSVCVSFTQYEVVVCNVGGANADCVDICPIICECPEFYSHPECIPPPCYDHECVYIFQGGNWVLEIPCPQHCDCAQVTPPTPQPGDQEGDRQYFSCLDPAGQCCDPVTDGVEVQTLQGNGPWPADPLVNGVEFVLTKTGEFSRTGSCSAQVAGMKVNVWDPGADPIVMCEADADASMQWEAGSNDCIWTVNIYECDENPWFSGLQFRVVGCAGGDCNVPGGLCGGMTNAEFTLNWGGVCSDPGAARLSNVAIGLLTQDPAEQKKLEHTPTPEVSSLGTSFHLKYPQYFAGCGCKRDVIAVMNRWEPGNVSDSRIERVIDTMVSKASGLNVDELRERLRLHVQ